MIRARLPFQLMIITDEGDDVVDRVSQALQGAVGHQVAVQLRQKARPAGALLEIARALRAETKRYGAHLLINDRLDVALACAADGVHLPQASLPPSEVRRWLPEGALVGVSCHDRAELEAAAAQGASYACLSPVHAVPGKGTPLGISGFRALAGTTGMPIIALGGLGAADVAPLCDAGAHGFAMIRAILRHDDPKHATQRILAAVRPARNAS